MNHDAPGNAEVTSESSGDVALFATADVAAGSELTKLYKEGTCAEAWFNQYGFRPWHAEPCTDALIDTLTATLVRGLRALEGVGGRLRPGAGLPGLEELQRGGRGPAA